MIIFDQLRVSDDGKKLYINLHVNNADYFKNIYLDSITIMTSDKVLEATNIGSPTEGFIYKMEFEDNTRVADIVLTKADIDVAFVNWNSVDKQVINPDKPYGKVSYNESFSNSLLFIYVECKEGALVGCPPCTLDELTTIGVTFDSTILHQKVMDFTKQLADDCIIPMGFTDFILLWNAFKAAIDTEHWVPAIKYWNMLFGIGEDGESYGPYGSGKTVSSGRKGCGCHG